MSSTNSLTSLNINTGVEVNPFKPEMLGTNIGIWENEFYYPTANPKLLNVIKEAGIKMLRYPAGGEADMCYFDRTNTYQWDQFPEHYRRTMRADHVDAVISLCKQTGAIPLLGVNVECNNPEMAADLVRYCNVDNDYNVKYFDLGNEAMYWKNLDGCKGYTERMVRYIKAMKEVDPSIMVINAAPPQPFAVKDWLIPVLEEAGEQLDVVSLHWYPLYDGVKDPDHAMFKDPAHLLYWDYGAETSIWSQIASLAFVERFIKTNPDSMINLRDKYAPNAKIGLTEVSPCSGSDVETGLSDTLANALWFGDILGRMACLGVDFVNQFLLQSEPQKYAMVNNSFDIAPVWYAYVMYHRYFGDMMLEINASDNTYFTIWASKKTGQDDKLYIMVINRHLTDDMTATINLSGFKPNNTAFKWELNSDSVRSLTAEINGVKVDENCYLPPIDGVLVNDVSENFAHTFPAHSTTCIEFTGSYDK